MRSEILVAAILAILSASACGMPTDPFLAEISSAPRAVGKDRTDIAAIVQKHISVGMPLADALRYVEERGFKVRPYAAKNVPVGQSWFLAEQESPVKPLIVERTRVIIESDGKRVLKAYGWIFLIGI